MTQTSDQEKENCTRRDILNSRINTYKWPLDQFFSVLKKLLPLLCFKHENAVLDHLF